MSAPAVEHSEDLPIPSIKHVVVTGASSGIGAAVAARFAREGAALTLLARDERKLRAVAATLDRRAAVDTLVADFSDPEAVSTAIRRLVERLPRLDALVHAAGVFLAGRALDDNQRDFEEMFRVNVHAPMGLTRALLPLLERNRGTIVFINSTGVQRPQCVGAQYVASKHALRALTDSLREELNPRDIRVTTIFPGRTATPMQRAVHEMEGIPYEPDDLLQSADVADVVACAVNLAPSAELVDLFLRPRRRPANIKR